MLKTEKKKSQTNQQQGRNAPATKKTKWKNTAEKTDKTKSIRNVRVGADGRPEPTIQYMDHAPVHPVYLHAVGLFRPVPHGKSESRLSVDKIYSMNKVNILCEWRGKHALNIVDQSVMMFLCQLAAQPSRAFQVSAALENTAVLMKSLNAAGIASDAIHTGVKTTLPEVARGIGLTATGNNSKAVLESLNRLAATRMRRTVLNADGSRSTGIGTTNVIGLVCDDDAQSIVLNAELSKACNRLGTVAWVNMRENRSLKSKPAKRLHAWFSWGAKETIKGECYNCTLLPKHIWGNEPCSSSAAKARAHTLRACIKDIANLSGWVCHMDTTKKKLVVRKPIFVGTQSLSAVTLTKTAETTTKFAETTTTGNPESSTGVASRSFSKNP